MVEYKYLAFKGVGALSAIFAIGVIAVSGVLIEQALQYQRENSYHYPGHFQFQRSGFGSFGGGGDPYYSQNYNQNFDYYNTPRGGLSTHDYYHTQEYYRYNPVIIISAAAICIGLIQLIVSFFLCCVHPKNSRPLTMIWMGGHLLILIGVFLSFALAFYYNVIYRRYHKDDSKDYYENIYLRYYSNNTKGIVFCVFLGLDLLFILASLIFVGVCSRRVDYDDDDNKGWHMGGGRGSTNGPAPKGNDNSYDERVREA